MKLKDIFKKFKKDKSVPIMSRPSEHTPDPLFEIYVEAWKRFHIASNAVDGGHTPTTHRQRDFAAQARKAGTDAMNEFLRQNLIDIPRDQGGLNKWNRANVESIRRYGK